MRPVLAVAAAWCAAAAQAPAPPAAPAREPGLYATLDTTEGAITVRLFEKEAPLTVRNFVALARGTKAWLDPKTGRMTRRPMYNGMAFHRVMPNFMIQAGDPTGEGRYYPGFAIRDEIAPGLRFDVPGRLAMANAGKPGTGNCQFFITEVPTPHLDGLHTIFGQVVEGQEVVNRIAHVPTVRERPVTPVRIRTVRFEREGPEPEPPVKKAGARRRQ